MNYRKKIVKIARIILTCVLICMAAFFAIGKRGGKTSSFAQQCLEQTVNDMGNRMIKLHSPVLTFSVSPPGEDSLWDVFVSKVVRYFPIYAYESTKPHYETKVESAISYEAIVASEAADENYVDDRTGDIVAQEVVEEDEKETDSTGNLKEDEAKAVSLEKLNDFDYLRQNFYVIDRTTTIKGSQLNAEKLLKKDLTIKKNGKGPQILIYHTHSQEKYISSKKGEKQKSVVDIAQYLDQLLEEKYGFEVLHHLGEYDVKSRDAAYSEALPAIEKILSDHPSIKVVIDMHRDAVKEDAHLIKKINGKKTAKIMFFNGLSRTTANGEITYLKNPNLQDNLAFSLQMQIAAATYYPGFTRPIYLKGYRYNMHLKPRTLLIEVGAQTNTDEEAGNAMEPLADLLNKVLTSQNE
ncbi:MAG: stage II sporulation protein P [Lachnospiraceae bacterium]